VVSQHYAVTVSATPGGRLLLYKTPAFIGSHRCSRIPVDTSGKKQIISMT